MGYLVTTILFLIAIMAYCKEKSLIHPACLFSILWASVSLLASFKMFGMMDASMKAWMVILVGSVAFVFGCGIRIKLPNNVFRITNVHFFSSNRNYWICYFVILLSMISELVRTIILIQQGNTLAMIRAASFGISKAGEYIASQHFIDAWLLATRDAIKHILVADSLCRFYSEKKMRFIISALTLVLFDAFTAGSRWVIAIFFIEFFVAASLYSSNGSHRKKNKRILIAVVLSIVLILLITIMRGGQINQGTWKYFYKYYCGCVPLLSFKLEEIATHNTWSIVLASQYGIWDFFIPVFCKSFGFDNLLNWYEGIIRVIMSGQVAYDIGGGLSMNAFTTCFYYLFVDFRWLGLIIGMFFWGMIAGGLYYATKNQRNGLFAIPYVIMSQMIIKSVQNYPLTREFFIISLILIFFFRQNYAKTN